MARRVLAYGVITYSVIIATGTMGWILGCLVSTELLHVLKVLAVNAPGALLGIGLVASIEEDEKWLSFRLVGARRIWLGAVALFLVVAVIAIGAIIERASPGFEDAMVLGLPFFLVVVIFVPQLYIIAALALMSIGSGIAELLGRDPLDLGLFRRDGTAGGDGSRKPTPVPMSRRRCRDVLTPGHSRRD